MLGIANKVGGIANKFVNNAGVIGKIAGGVSKAANLVSTIVPKISPVVNAITTGAKLAYQSGLADAKLAYQSGLADKLTGGKATRLVKGVQNMFSPPRGVQQNNAAAVRQAGSTTGSKELARIM